MCSIIGVGERLHKVLGQIDLGTLDSGERSLPFGLLVFYICGNFFCKLRKFVLQIPKLGKSREYVYIIFLTLTVKISN